jgi:hypothetical protein
MMNDGWIGKQISWPTINDGWIGKQISWPTINGECNGEQISWPMIIMVDAWVNRYVGPMINDGWMDW